MASPSVSEADWDTPGKVSDLRVAAGSDLAPFVNDEETLRRFLRARKGDLDAALKMLQRHQQFRTEECVPYGWPARTVAVADVLPCLNLRSAYVRGKDRANRPIVVVKARLHDSKMSRDVLRRYVVFMLDELVTRCCSDGYADSFTAILDAGDMSWNSIDADLTKLILLMLSANYPERLGRLYILNDGLLFRGLWKIVETFIDARTAAKIKFLGGPDKHRASLLETVAPENLPVEYGGTDAYSFNPEDVASTAASPSTYLSVQGGVKLARSTAIPAVAGAAPTIGAAAGAGSAAAAT